MKLFYHVLNWNDIVLPLAFCKKGLVYVGAFDETVEEMQAWYDRKQQFEWVEHPTENIYATQLQEYLDGKRQVFEFPIAFLKGTDFQKEVWCALCQVPFGQKSSYTQVAEKINRPKAVRAVGTAIGMNPLSIVVPCHRILTKNGQLGGYRGGLSMKMQLLKLETPTTYE